MQLSQKTLGSNYTTVKEKERKKEDEEEEEKEDVDEEFVTWDWSQEELGTNL